MIGSGMTSSSGFISIENRLRSRSPQAAAAGSRFRDGRTDHALVIARRAAPGAPEAAWRI
jgi:hypothetical protein